MRSDYQGRQDRRGNAALWDNDGGLAGIGRLAEGARGIEHVAIESTGVYWKPVWNILEAEGFDLLLANAQEVKIVPGRKTDQKDSQWIADWRQHGLLRKSSC